MQVFYTYVDNFVDGKNKRESYLCVSFYNCGVLKKLHDRLLTPLF